jgi:aryl-alcohol dehydrogenase-like predicted oxidoreductase
MKYRELGRRTGLRVSEVGLGAWGLGGRQFVLPAAGGGLTPATYGDVSEDEARALLQAVLDCGINFIDTAPYYGAGRSEARIGRAIKGRDDIIVATKVGVFIDDAGRSGRRFTRDVVMTQLDESRRRLGRDVIDIELLHSPTHEEYGTGESLEALHTLKAQGKVRFVGVSVNLGEKSPNREFIERGEVDVIELPISLLRPQGAELLPLARAHGVGIIVREALANGMLTGQFTPDTVFGKDDFRSKWPRQRIITEYEQFKRLSFLCEDGVRTPSQVALQWVLSLEGVSTVIGGAMSRSELLENAAVPDLPPLSEEMLARVRAVQGLVTSVPRVY